MTLREPLLLIVLVAAAALPGALAARLCGKHPADDLIEFIFAALSLGLLVLGWPAFLLAEIGAFSLAALIGGWLAVTAGLAAAWFLRQDGADAVGSEDYTTETQSAQSARIGTHTAGDTNKNKNAVIRARPRSSASHLRASLRAFGVSAAIPGTVNCWEAAALGVWLLVAGGIYLRPHEFVIGGADAGVYVNLAAQIATTGRILADDSLLAELPAGEYPAWLRAMPLGEAAPYYLLPGFYVTGEPRGRITPQFYHLHPVWQAVGHALGGLRLALLMTPLWALLGCLSVYMTVRRLWGRWAGLLALLGLSATALQVWFARYPTAEMLTQTLLWTGGWALTAWLDDRRPRVLWALIAGLALGQVFLTRIDTYVLLAVPVLIGIWLTWTRGWRRADLWFFVPFALLAAHSVIHGLVISRPYFLAQMGTGIRVIRPLILPAAVAFLGVLGLGALAVTRSHAASVTLANQNGTTEARRTRRYLTGLRALCVSVVIPGVGDNSRAHAWLRTLRRILLWLAAGVVLALAVYAYFLRPGLTAPRLYAFWYGGGQVPNLDHENLVRLGWYLTPLGIGLAAAGVALMLVREANRRTAFMLGTGLFFSFMFLWHIGANPHQIYAMRRYVPYVLPFFVVTAVYLIQWLAGRLRGKMRWPAVGLTMVWIAGIVAASRGFVSQVDYGGFIAQLDRLNASLAPRSVLIFNDSAAVGLGDFVGTPLRFLYDHDVFVLRDPAALTTAGFTARVAEWQAQDRTVYWAAVVGGHAWPAAELDLSPPQEQQLTGAVLEGSYERKPQQIVPFEWALTLAQVADAAGP